MKSGVLFPNAASNKGMHPTANQRGSHREIVHSEFECAAVDARR